jgi:hypothetical protein
MGQPLQWRMVQKGVIEGVDWVVDYFRQGGEKRGLYSSTGFLLRFFFRGMVINIEVTPPRPPPHERQHT